MRLRSVRLPVPRDFSVYVLTNKKTVTDVYLLVPFSFRLVVVSRVVSHLGSLGELYFWVVVAYIGCDLFRRDVDSDSV